MTAPLTLDDLPKCTRHEDPKDFSPRLEARHYYKSGHEWTYGETGRFLTESQAAEYVSLKSWQNEIGTENAFLLAENASLKSGRTMSCEMCNQAGKEIERLNTLLAEVEDFLKGHHCIDQVMYRSELCGKIRRRNDARAALEKKT